MINNFFNNSYIYFKNLSKITKFFIFGAIFLFVLSLFLNFFARDFVSSDVENDIIISNSQDFSQLPSVISYQQAISKALSESLILLSRDKLKEEQALSQILFQKFLSDSKIHNNKERTEIMIIAPIRDSDISEDITSCKQLSNCYKVEAYNYALNSSLTGVVDIAQRKVIKYFEIKNSQPDISRSLTDIALDISVASRDVQKIIGRIPSRSEFVMPETKTSLDKSKCERQRHLCVAPTLLTKDKALWVIVDLTDFKVVALRWTDLGKFNGFDKSEIPTEKSIKNKYIMEHYCNKDTAYGYGDWKFKFTLTSSDGMKISDIYFKETKVLENVKLVDWHVSYSKDKGFGYSDAIGCPVFSQAAVVAYEPPEFSDILIEGKVVGHKLVQEYRSDGWPQPCNYNYEQVFEFYNDGNFRAITSSLGRGCGDDGTYRPVIRYELPNDSDIYKHYLDLDKNIVKETWFHEDQLDKINPINVKSDNFNLKFYTVNNFKNTTKTDNAYWYFTKRNLKEDEGISDLITIGPCCNVDYKQGPEKFINDEVIEKSKNVIWYVPQLKNNSTKGSEYCWADTQLVNGKYQAITYRCDAGPILMFSINEKK